MSSVWKFVFFGGPLRGGRGVPTRFTHRSPKRKMFTEKRAQRETIKKLKMVPKSCQMPPTCYQKVTKKENCWSSAPETGKSDPLQPARADQGSGCPESTPDAEEKRGPRPGFPRVAFHTKNVPACLQNAKCM